MSEISRSTVFRSKMKEESMNFEDKAKNDLKKAISKIIIDSKYEMDRRPEKAEEISAIISALMEHIDTFFQPENIRKVKKSAKNNNKQDIER